MLVEQSFLPLPDFPFPWFWSRKKITKVVGVGGGGGGGERPEKALPGSNLNAPSKQDNWGGGRGWASFAPRIHALHLPATTRRQSRSGRQPHSRLKGLGNPRPLSLQQPHALGQSMRGCVRACGREKNPHFALLTVAELQERGGVIEAAVTGESVLHHPEGGPPPPPVGLWFCPRPLWPFSPPAPAASLSARLLTPLTHTHAHSLRSSRGGWAGAGLLPASASCHDNAFTPPWLGLPPPPLLLLLSPPPPPEGGKNWAASF